MNRHSGRLIASRDGNGGVEKIRDVKRRRKEPDEAEKKEIYSGGNAFGGIKRKEKQKAKRKPDGAP